MIFNLLRNALVALLLHAGAALAFNTDNQAQTTDTIAATPQSCTLPADTNPPTNHFDDTGVHS